MDQNRPAEIANNKEEVPLQFYLERFPMIDPEERAEQLGVPFENGAFTVTMLGVTYRIAWPTGEVSSEDPEAIAVRKIPGQIMLLRYLMEGSNALGTGAYKTFREMPWGEVYIKPFTGRCLMRSAFKFGTNLAGFRKGAENSGGTALSHGDAGYSFPFIGPYELQIFVWEGDDEFPPSSQILYSDNFAAGFSAEDCVVAAELMIGTIAAHM